MDKKAMATVKNISNMRVGLSCPDLHFRRVIDPRKQIKVDKETLEEAIGISRGVAALFEKQILAIIELEIREELEYTGIPVELAPTALLDEEEVIKLLNEGTDLDVKELLEDASEDRRTMVADLAIHKADNISASKMDLIYKKTNINVMNARNEIAKEKADDEAKAKAAQ